MMMQTKKSRWRQFGAGFDKLGHALVQGLEAFFWAIEQFFYEAFPSLLLLDYYLPMLPEDFASVRPFTPKQAPERPQQAADDVAPDTFCRKQELFDYVDMSQVKCQKIIAALAEEKWRAHGVEDVRDDAMSYPLLEALLYNMRHVQLLMGQLGLLLRQGAGPAPKGDFRVNEAHGQSDDQSATSATAAR